MENAEEIFHFLEEFSKRKPKTIPQELNDYLAYVARTGDPIYQWPLVKCLFKEKLLNVITEFYETTPGIDIPPYPNVDPFNYDIMKNSLLERLDTFTSAPFTVQRICELLTYPRKQYNRVDKFMRAIEKNILVVSTREPGIQRHIEAENGELIVNGSDNNSDYNVDVEMEDMSWKETSESKHIIEPQPSSSDTHISVDDLEARLKAKQDAPMEVHEKISTQYESVTPPELNINAEETIPEQPSVITSDPPPTTSVIEEVKSEPVALDVTANNVIKTDVEMKSDHIVSNQTLIIPDIKVDDAEMTEQRLIEQSNSEKEDNNVEKEFNAEIKSDALDSQLPHTVEEHRSPVEDQQNNIDESSSDSKEESETKLVSDVATSSEESSSSSDNTDCSNSPKAAENQAEITEETSQSDNNIEEEKTVEVEKVPKVSEEANTPVVVQSDNYSISDVKSELPETSLEVQESKELVADVAKVEESTTEEKVEVIKVDNPEATSHSLVS